MLFALCFISLQELPAGFTMSISDAPGTDPWGSLGQAGFHALLSLAGASCWLYHVDLRCSRDRPLGLSRSSCISRSTFLGRSFLLVDPCRYHILQGQTPGVLSVKWYIKTGSRRATSSGSERGVPDIPSVAPLQGRR